MRSVLTGALRHVCARASWPAVSIQDFHLVLFYSTSDNAHAAVDLSSAV